MWHGRPMWAEIDLGAIESNVAAIKSHLREGTEVMAVVKANAYGHGAVRAARAALAGGARWLAVNIVDEGVALRRAGLTCRILVLGYIPPWEADKVIFYSLTPTVNTHQLAMALASAAQRRTIQVPVHVKVDTGLSRYGLPPEAVVPFVQCLANMPRLQFEALWTHFASADEADKTFTRAQLDVYLSTLGRLAEAGLLPSLRHAANSAAALDLPEAHMDFVRLGISIYGLYPSTEVSRAVPLQPAMALKSRVARLRLLPAGSTVGYGRTFTAEGETLVALVPAGYGDGLRRSLANTGQVLIRGRRARIVGRVSMDQLVADVTGIPGVEHDDEVVILGQQGEDAITAEELAGWMGTINYEVVTGISQRVPRVYRRDGEEVAVETMNGDE